MRVHFQPQAWVNDYSIDVDDEGEDTWTITPDTLTAVRATLRPGVHDLDLDFVTGDANAPEWVRNWGGGYTIEIVCPACDGFTYKHPCRWCDTPFFAPMREWTVQFEVEYPDRLSDNDLFTVPALSEDHAIRMFDTHYAEIVLARYPGAENVYAQVAWDD